MIEPEDPAYRAGRESAVIAQFLTAFDDLDLSQRVRVARFIRRHLEVRFDLEMYRKCTELASRSCTGECREPDN